jgi:uncharacterized repeat protein (TIGR03803 family)
MKTHVQNLFLVLACTGLLAMTVTAQAQFNYYDYGNGTIAISGYTGSDGAVTIPSTINGLPVSTISGAAFFFNGSITSVTIPNSVTLIGSGAFQFCTSLTNVIIGDSVINIEDSAFRGCTSLISVTFKGNAPAYVGQYVFGFGYYQQDDTNATVYYLPGTTGWSSTFAGLPTMPLAAVFTDMHTFTATAFDADYYLTNTDGANPYAGLVLSGNTLYGTAGNGGIYGVGSVFAINTDGTGFTNLYSFTMPSNDYPSTNSDGYGPHASLVLSGNTLYGTAGGGGSGGSGTIFKINTDGTGFTNLYSFSARNNGTNSDGDSPAANLILSGNTLYGTAMDGGTSRNGTVFAINTDGTDFTNLHSFSATGESYNNSDGASPEAGLTLSGNTLYGTTEGGGTWGVGTIFAINTDGSGFTNLYSFTGGYTGGTDGGNPYAGLIISGNTLYGASCYDVFGGSGSVFAINTDGTGFTNVYRFTGGNDGGSPLAGLTLSGNTLYGATGAAGSGGNGTVFAVNTDGSGFITLYSFTATDNNNANSDGAESHAVLVLSGNTLYGTAAWGGSSGNGTVFSLTLPPPVIAPQLAINLSGTNVILTWPTNATGFTLQSTTNLISPVWSAVSPAPVVVNTNNAVTNSIFGAQMFYRLSQ